MNTLLALHLYRAVTSTRRLFRRPFAVWLPAAGNSEANPMGAIVVRILEECKPNRFSPPGSKPDALTPHQRRSGPRVGV